MEKTRGEQISDFKMLAGMGIDLTLGKIIDADTIKLPRLVRQTTDIYYAEAFDEQIILVNFIDDRVGRIKAVVTKLRKQFNLPVVIMLPQLTQSSRKILLENKIPFLTQMGEAFLPFLGTRLLAVKNAPATEQQTFSPIAQRLFILLLMAQIGYEKKGISLFSDFKVDNHLITFKGGNRFIFEVGRRIGINSRTSFMRAVDELISSEVIRATGETRERRYSFILGSQNFFARGRSLLTSPIARSVMYFDKNEWTLLNCQREKSVWLLATGLNALSKVTMISKDRPSEFVTDRADFVRIASGEASTTSRQSAEYILQKSAYNLMGFNALYQEIDDQYPTTCVDPINLYLAMIGNSNERVQSELEELLFGVLGEN
ncbi:hypothetical protein [Levilactobacillus fujinensis]|uniref:MarR family transcriptional regulator n=1 Tax=Levilactobacillus fujinensis TaxID=2486024 RepID=A0ABW1TDN9_9LACO